MRPSSCKGARLMPLIAGMGNAIGGPLNSPPTSTTESVSTMPYDPTANIASGLTNRIGDPYLRHEVDLGMNMHKLKIAFHMDGVQYTFSATKTISDAQAQHVATEASEIVMKPHSDWGSFFKSMLKYIDDLEQGGWSFDKGVRENIEIIAMEKQLA